MLFRNLLALLFVLISISANAKETKFEKRLQKDIKKLSKLSGFIDSKLKLYGEDTIMEKNNLKFYTAAL